MAGSRGTQAGRHHALYGRRSAWQRDPESRQTHGDGHPRWFRHAHPPAEEEWFTLEAGERLAEIMKGLDERSMADQGAGGGMDVGCPRVGDHLEDGRRSPGFFKRLTAAWQAVLCLYLDGDLMDWWTAPMRKKIGRGLVDWAVMEHVWANSHPPCDNMRSFGFDIRAN